MSKMDPIEKIDKQIEELLGQNKDDDFDIEELDESVEMTEEETLDKTKILDTVDSTNLEEDNKVEEVKEITKKIEKIEEDDGEKDLDKSLNFIITLILGMLGLILLLLIILGL